MALDKPLREMGMNSERLLWPSKGPGHFETEVQDLESKVGLSTLGKAVIVSGRVTHKMAPPLRQIYDQMLEPKWVIAMGACASSGGMFNNYTILQSVDKIVPVDMYVPGCPPRPEQLMEGIIRLHEAVQAGVPPAYELRPVAS